jgi:CDP-glucose 4,6-dehydratase
VNNLLQRVYKGKKVLITGHTGFKGSWLAIWLAELGADLRGYALPPVTDRDNYVLAGLDGKITGITGDIRDYGKLSQVLEEFQPEIVFHLAAQAIVRQSYAEPKETFDVNIGGTVNLLEAVRKTGSVRVVINVTSDKCYENKEWVWGYRENDPMGGFDPYSSSKGCAELVTAAYRNSFFNPKDSHPTSLATVRAGNVIGGGDWSRDRIIPDCIRALMDHQPIEVRNPRAVRPWQFVLEPLSAYLWLAAEMYQKGDRYGGAWNFGPDRDAIIPVRDVVSRIIKYWGDGNWLDVSQGDQKGPHEASFLSLDCSKAKTYLGWKPCLTIEQALEWTVEWYKNYRVVPVSDFCVSQITRFTAIAREKDLPWSIAADN